MRLLLQRWVSWTIKIVAEKKDVRGLAAFDVRWQRDPHSFKHLDNAMVLLERVGSPHLDLVCNEVHAVFFTSYRSTILPGARAYFTPLAGYEGSSDVFLASRLVWIAAYMQSFLQALTSSATFDETMTERECLRLQLDFLDRLGERAGWVENLRSKL